MTQEKKFIYQCFTFNPRIQEHTYLGDYFLGMDQVTETRNMSMFDRVVDAGPEGLLPQFVEELKKIFGEGNYSYDGYEIGEEEYSLYFLINEKVYQSSLEKVDKWSEYHGFRDLIFWENKLLLNKKHKKKNEI